MADKRKILLESYDIRAKRIQYQSSCNVMFMRKDQLSILMNPTSIAPIHNQNVGQMIVYWD
jgi:hypothetical protein